MRLGKFIPPTWLVLGFVLVATFLLKLRNLDHSSLTRWDEVFHAVVAQNVLKHPLKPTLVDVPYLAYDYTNWRENHIWLHKPILPFWQIALSFALLGVNTLALRLPAAILSTGAAWLTYLIGKELFGRGVGLVAAFLQAINPFLLTVVHGYQFADNVDVALLFWVEAGMYFLVRAVPSGDWRYVVLAGVAQGLAFLCKSYLAGIILGVALTACLLPVCRLGRRADCRLSLLHVFLLAYTTLLTVTPWLVYCLINFPQEFWLEEFHTWEHLNTSVGPWGAPWTKVVYDYLIAIYGVFYAPALVATIIFIGRAVVRRQAGLWLVLAWGLGVLVPHLVAVTKTPSATLLALPAFLLLVGYLVVEACRGDRLPLAALTGLMAMSVIAPAVVKTPAGDNPVLNGNMEESGWLFIQVAGALEIAAIGAIVGMIAQYRAAGAASILARYTRVIFISLCLVVLAWLGFRTGQTAWQVTDCNLRDPASLEVGRFARSTLPDNAVLICEEHKNYEHLTTMFYADRTCYALARAGPDEMASQLEKAGALPYVVAYRPLPLVAVYRCANNGPTVYMWRKS